MVEMYRKKENAEKDLESWTDNMEVVEVSVIDSKKLYAYGAVWWDYLERMLELEEELRCKREEMKQLRLTQTLFHEGDRGYVIVPSAPKSERNEKNYNKVGLHRV
jgi:hypothetical protein